MQQLKVDEYAGWGSDAFATWAENHDIQLQISPGQVHTRTSVVERRHQLLRRAVQIYMDDNEIAGVDALHEALNWVVPSLNEHTFVNGFTPTQLAMGRQPAVPGLMSEERTKPPQLSEGQHLQEILKCRSQAQQACAKADVDVRLRRAMLRQYRGRDEDLVAGERCLYWRESTDRFHTIKWKGPAVVVAVQLDPDTGNVDTYWLAHGTVLIRAGKHHVKRLVDAEGRISSPVEAMRQVRQRRVVRMIDLHKTNKRSIDELDEDDADIDLDDGRKQRKHGNPPHQLQLHGPVSPLSPAEPIADDAATEPDVEILDSPADEFHDALEQIERQIEQLEQPPDTPYEPTTPAESVTPDNDEPINDNNVNSNDASTTAIPPNEMPADEDLPPVPPDDSDDENAPAAAVTNTMPAETLVTLTSDRDVAEWIKEKWLGSETSKVKDDHLMNPKMTLSRNAKGSSTVSKLVSTAQMAGTTSLPMTCCLMVGLTMKSPTPLSLARPKTSGQLKLKMASWSEIMSLLAMPHGDQLPMPSKMSPLSWETCKH